MSKPGKPAPFGYGYLTREGSRRLAERIEQQLDALADEILRNVVAGMFAAFTARQAQRRLEPARIRQRGRRSAPNRTPRL